MGRNKTLKKAISLRSRICDLNKKMRLESEEYIRFMLMKSPNQEYVFGDENALALTIVYDGGRHPEYASNAFSIVERVFINQYGYLCVATEDTEEYSFVNLSADEIFSIADYINAYPNW